MGIFIDTASIREIGDSANYPFLAGVTTNPKLIAKALSSHSVAREHFLEHIKRIKQAFEGELFVQTNYSATEKIVEEGKEIHQVVGDRLVFKIPISLPGLQAMKELSEDGIRTASTSIFTAMQGYLSMESGASYVIPYYSRIMNAMGDGLEVIEDMLDFIDNGGYDCQVLVASMKTPFDVLEVIRAGAQAVTLPPPLLASLIPNPHTISAATEFEMALKIVDLPMENKPKENKPKED